MSRHWVPADGPPRGVTLKDIAWLAGFMEGEGSFFFTTKRNPEMRASQVQRQPLERCNRIAGGRIGRLRRPNPKWQPTQTWYVGGSLAVQWMMTLYGEMSPKRRGQIRRVLDAWRLLPIRKVDRTHCPHGHEYTPENVRPLLSRDGRRYRACRACSFAGVWPSRVNRTRIPLGRRRPSRDQRQAQLL